MMNDQLRLEGFTTSYASTLARQAGRLIRQSFSNLGVPAQIKDDKTPLTETDKKINDMVVEKLSQDFPSLNILGEEGVRRTDSLWTVTFDPIDGTFPFVWGVPMSLFMMALLYDGQPVLSVIYEPFFSRMFTAELGKGAKMNGQTIAVSTDANTSNQSIIAFSSLPQYDFPSLEVARALERQGCMIVDYGCIGYAQILVAAGKFGGCIFPGSQPHDSAAGALLVTEAGGKVTSLFGKEQRYDRPVTGHVMSNGHLHNLLFSTIMEVIRG